MCSRTFELAPAEERSGAPSLPAISKDDHGGTRSSSIDLEFNVCSRTFELAPVEKRSGAPEVATHYL